MSLDIIKKYNIKAKKSLWQNFLVNDLIVSQIANIIDIKNKNIVEVGPWYGALTEKLLLNKPKFLTLIELDQEMIEILIKREVAWDFFLDWVWFKIDNIDVLKYEPEFRDYSVIANIPYYITSPILRHFLYNVKNKPENMIILVQKDVWDKILWNWKQKSSVLSLFINKKSNVSEKIFVSRQNFVPSPKVESSVLLFETHNKYEEINDDLFLEIIKLWFREPRKKLLKNFINSWLIKEKITKIFDDLWIEHDIRWEDLDIEYWTELVKRYSN